MVRDAFLSNVALLRMFRAGGDCLATFRWLFSLITFPISSVVLPGLVIYYSVVFIGGALSSWLTLLY